MTPVFSTFLCQFPADENVQIAGNITFCRCLLNCKFINNIFYYTYMSVLPKIRQLVFSIRNYIQDMSEIFSISSLVKISLTSFLCFSSSFFFSKHSYLCNKKKITRWFEHMKFIFSWKKDFTHLLHSLLKYFFHLKINFIIYVHATV